MSAALTLFTHPMSRGRIAHWMLEECGVPYEIERLEFDGSMKAPAYRAINPFGKVPSLRHGDRIVTETAAICAYLADAFPQAGLAPPTAERADYYRWLFFGAGPLEAAVTNRALGVQVPPERRGMVGYGDHDVLFDTLADACSRFPYLAGERFSAADVYIGSQVGFGMRFGSIEKRPEFVDYWTRLRAREAWQRLPPLPEGTPGTPIDAKSAD